MHLPQKQRFQLASTTKDRNYIMVASHVSRKNRTYVNLSNIHIIKSITFVMAFVSVFVS